MDNRRAKLIADVIKHLEALDADELSSKMAPPPGDEMPPAEGVEEVAVMEAEAPPMGNPEEEVDDDELEELAKLSS